MLEPKCLPVFKDTLCVNSYYFLLSYLISLFLAPPGVTTLGNCGVKQLSLIASPNAL